MGDRRVDDGPADGDDPEPVTGVEISDMPAW
jgi:hypothetical protein